MEKLLGLYQLGLRPVRLYVDAESGNGSVEIIPTDKGPTKVIVGLDHHSFSRAVSVLLHESYEIMLIDQGTRYEPHPAASYEASNFIFVATHNQLDEAHSRVSQFLVAVYTDFKRAYDKSVQQKAGKK